MCAAATLRGENQVVLFRCVDKVVCGCVGAAIQWAVNANRQNPLYRANEGVSGELGCFRAQV